MINNFEQLRDFVNFNQERIFHVGDIVCREKTQEGPTFDDFIKKRIDDNLKKIEDIGVVELFQKIKSENLLGNHVNVIDGSLEEFKRIRSRSNVSGYVPHLKKTEEWGRFLDRSILVRLMWDPQFGSDISTGCSTTEYRQIVVFVNESNPVLTYSTWMPDGSKPNEVNSTNLFNLMTEALLKAQRGDLELNPLNLPSSVFGR